MTKPKFNPRPVTYGDVTKELSHWAKELGISESLLAYRINRYGVNVMGLDDEEYYQMVKDFASGEIDKCPRLLRKQNKHE